MQNSAPRNIMQKGFGSGFLGKRWQETMCKCIAESRVAMQTSQEAAGIPSTTQPCSGEKCTVASLCNNVQPGSSTSQTSAWETSEHQDLSIHQAAEKLPTGMFEPSLWWQLNISSVTTVLRVSHRFFAAGMWDIFFLFSEAQSIKNFSNGSEVGNGRL